ncbi:MAG: GNAT family N-acetyltransferase [Smithellaceae bacterium]|nr:GNAT family N-acetyltransferase [Smithellaceae bacterium]
MKLELIPVAGNLKRIREIWESLEAGSNISYFLSWGWIENWMASLPDHAKPELAVFLEGNDPRLAFFIGKLTLTLEHGDFHGQRHLFKSRGWFLNATGIPAFDRVCPEYNGFLCKPHESFKLTDILNGLPDSWDEFYLPGLDMRSFPGTKALDDLSPYKTIIKDDTIVLSPFVDLDKVRARDGDYLSLLSANTRSQINRSYRLCEKTAPVQLEIARDTRSAMDIYHELVSLHENIWTNRSQGGAFCSDYLFHFHKQLIQGRFKYNEIQLLRIKCGDDTMGCLYNFVYKNNVYFYQSGMNFNLDKRLKPGLIAHVEAIRHNTGAGHKIYDFLGGGSRYKMSLATDHSRMIWIRLQKPLLKFKIENNLKMFKHRLIGLHKILKKEPR